MGNKDIEDSLERLDKSTQEEARMASAELLKVTHSMDGKVTGVDDRVKRVEGKVQNVHDDVHGVTNKIQNVDDRVQGIGEDISNRVEGVGDKLDHINRCDHFDPCSPENSDLFAGNQLRDSFLRWLLPPDPSANHNIARKAHHKGTTQWFFQRSVFSQWKSFGSFLWVHGKRVLFLTFTIRRPLIISHFIAGSGKSVVWFAFIRLFTPS